MALFLTVESVKREEDDKISQMIKKDWLNWFHPRLKRKFIRLGQGKRTIIFYNPSPLRRFLFLGGTFFVLGAVFLAAIWCFPLIMAFLRYQFFPVTPPHLPPATMTTAKKIDYQNFFIYIPKIKAKAKVFANTPVNNPQRYLEVLHRGVAHAQGSGFPGGGKTIYLFAHSTNSPFYATRLNAVFMLLNYLQPGDLIILYFNGHRYHYQVVKKKVVSPAAVHYLLQPPQVGGETLILQTCYPPGTTWRRLLVFARLTQSF